MPYDALSESWGINSQLHEERFYNLMDDLWQFDHGRWFKLTEAIGRCPSIQHYSPSTQANILRVAFRDLLNPVDTADGFIRRGFKLKYQPATKR